MEITYVLVIFEIEIINRELIPEEFTNKIKNTFPQICIEMINNMEKELEEDNKDIYHYESKILHYPRENIWEIIFFSMVFSVKLKVSNIGDEMFLLFITHVTLEYES